MRSIARSVLRLGQGAPAERTERRGRGLALLRFARRRVSIVDLFTPQLFIAAILFNGPIALSSLALQSRLTTNLVIAAEIANVIAGYFNGVQAGHHWDGIAIGDRLLLAASFVLVGYLSIRTQEYAREAGVSAGRMRQVKIEKALREATGRVRGTLNVELVQRAITRESVALLGASSAILVVRESTFGPLVHPNVPCAMTATSRFERRALSMEMASLVMRAAEIGRVIRVTANDPLGRLTLEALGAKDALVRHRHGRYGKSRSDRDRKRASAFVPDAVATLRAFAQQAAWRWSRRSFSPSSATVTRRSRGKKTSSPGAATSFAISSMRWRTICGRRWRRRT